MKYTLDENTLTLQPEGRIDSVSSEVFRREMMALCAEYPRGRVVMDAENMRYISSSGLRVILEMRRKYPSFCIKNASREVYEVMEYSGFTEIIPIEKAYRRLSVEGCEVIGHGSNGLVYRLDRDTIVKVYRNAESLPDIQRERELSRKAFVMGIPTAIPFDVVRVGECYGSVFELLNARSAASVLREEPYRLEELAHMQVELLKKMHSVELAPGEIPDKRADTLSRIEFLRDHLPQEQYGRLYALAEAVPEDHHLLHGDFHLRNVMLMNNEPLLIDMDTLCLGHPVFEFASVYMAYQGYGELDPDEVTNYMGIPYDRCVRLMRAIFFEYYGLHSEEEYRAVLDKARVIGYARMMRRAIHRLGGTRYGREFAAYCAKQLSVLLPRVDSLVL